MSGDRHRGVIVGRSVGVVGGKAQRWHSHPAVVMFSIALLSHGFRLVWFV